jgi:hypothetical protein
MQKAVFYKNKSTNQNINRKRLFNAQYTSQKQVVDINKLLNRVKIDKKNETKRKIIFFISSILGFSLIGTLIVFLK